MTNYPIREEFMRLYGSVAPICPICNEPVVEESREYVPRDLNPENKNLKDFIRAHAACEAKWREQNKLPRTLIG